jgi:hypothetical protein
MRARVLSGLEGEVAGRLASRWVRWADTFCIATLDPSAGQAEQFGAPYRPAESTQKQEYLNTVLPLFDAALGILGATLDAQGETDHGVLTTTWRQVCLPSAFTPATAYGRHTQAALSVLRFADGMPAAALRRMVTGRAALDEHAWQAAKVQADIAAMDAGYPYRARCLYWESVPAAEQAARQSPTEKLVDALWGAAVVQILSGQLTATTPALLRSPYRASGAVLPN